MDRLEHTLGLRAHRAGARLFMPLPRALARAVRAAIAAHPEHAEVHPLADLGLPAVRALTVARGPARLTYVLGGTLAALRGVLLVEGATEDVSALTAELEPGDAALPALAAIVRGELLRPASAETRATHAAALARGRADPVWLARAWLDGERWPPPPEGGRAAADARTFEDAPSELHLAGPARGLYTALPDASAAHLVAARGLIARRWLTLEGHPLRGASPLTDLHSGGAAFVFSRVLGSRARALPAGCDYAALWAPHALTAAERWVLERDRFGAEGALVDALADGALAERLDGLPMDHEVLHFDRLPRAWLRAIVCRDEAARAALGEVEVPVIVDVRVPAADAPCVAVTPSR